MSYNNPLEVRRRRRGTSAAVALAAVLSALLYQCSDHRKAGQNPASVGTAAQHAPRATSGDASRAEQGRQVRTEANKNFEFYVLALSLAPAFCQDGHQSMRECRTLSPQSFAATPLTLHGLWPENPRPERYRRECDGARPQLLPATRSALRRWMPGEADGLADHEWRKHGACTGLSADDYFNAAIDWTAQVNTVIGSAIRNTAGGNADAATLRAAANTVRPGIGESLVFVCKNLRAAAPAQRRRAFLTEVRLCLTNDGPGGAPRAALNCARMQRRDQGCGGSFLIDAP